MNTFFLIATGIVVLFEFISWRFRWSDAHMMCLFPGVGAYAVFFIALGSRISSKGIGYFLGAPSPWRVIITCFVIAPLFHLFIHFKDWRWFVRCLNEEDRERRQYTRREFGCCSFIGLIVILAGGAIMMMSRETYFIFFGTIIVFVGAALVGEDG